MKKIVIAFFSAMAVLFLASCGTTQAVEAAETPAATPAKGTPKLVIAEKEGDWSIDLEAEKAESHPLVKDVYKDYFPVGTAASEEDVVEHISLFSGTLENFSILVPVYETKMYKVLDEEYMKSHVSEDPCCIKLDFSHAQPIIDCAIERGMNMRYHTLVWHKSNHEWFFHEDYDETRPYVSADLFKERFRAYIFAVIEYLDKNHPGLFCAIDVVNEPFNDMNSDEHYHVTSTNGEGSDPNPYFAILGEDYVYYAFRFAKEAIEASASMKDVALVCNDYNMNEDTKRTWVMDGLDAIFAKFGEDPHDYIDTIGFQGHYRTAQKMSTVLNAVKDVASHGYKVQITEYDMNINTSAGREDQFKIQGAKTKYLMQGLMELCEQGVEITEFVAWEMNDETSWQSAMFPTLFDADNQPKPAFYGILLDDDIKTYYGTGVEY